MSSANFNQGMPKRRATAIKVSPLTTVYVPDTGIGSVPVTGFEVTVPVVGFVEVTVPVVGLVEVIDRVGVIGVVGAVTHGTTLVDLMIRVVDINPVGIRRTVVDVDVHTVGFVVERDARAGVEPTATKLAASTYTSLCCIAKYGCERVHTETTLFLATASTLNSENRSKLS